MNSLLRYLLAFVAAVTALAALALPAAADSHVADQYTAECDADSNTPDIPDCDDAAALAMNVKVEFRHLIRWIRANPDLIDIPIYEEGDDENNEVLLALSDNPDEEKDAIVAEAYFTTRKACRDNLNCPEEMSELVGSDGKSVATLGQLKVWVDAWLDQAKARLLTEQTRCADRLDNYGSNYRCNGLYGRPVYIPPDPRPRTTQVPRLPPQPAAEVRVALDGTPDTTNSKSSTYGLTESGHVVAKVYDKCFVWDGERGSSKSREVACP